MKHQKRGFSFVQIIIILVLLVLLIGGIIYVLKPSQVLEKSRDSQRFSDLKNISAALNQYIAEGHDFQGLVGPYSSIDTGFNNDKARQQIDGKGWIPLNFSSVSQGLPFSSLPIDPLNSATYNYRFGVSVSSKTYEINTVFESPQNKDKLSNDNGNDTSVYELGTDLTIL